MAGSDCGTYCLLISCRKRVKVRIGKLGEIDFIPGYYLYIGSALNNLQGRLVRHKRKQKKVFWHIDYLTSHKYFNVETAYTIKGAERLECRKASWISQALPAITGFGSSDCRCGGHLFYTGEHKKISGLEKDIIIKAGFKRYHDVYSY